MGNLDYLSDNLIELQGPVDMATNAAVPNDPDSCEAKLYDADLDCRVSDLGSRLAEETVAGDTIVVEQTVFLTTGSIILIQTTNDRFIERTIQSVDGLNLILTVDIGAGIPKGNLVNVHTRSIGAGFIPLDDASEWKTDMTMEITNIDGTTSEFSLGYVDHVGSFVWLGGDALSTAVRVGAVVKRRLGATPDDDIDMTTPYGSFPASDPVAGDEAWGFRGVIPHDHPELALGLRVRGEITYVDGTVNLRRKVVATVINE